MVNTLRTFIYPYKMSAITGFHRANSKQFVPAALQIFRTTGIPVTVWDPYVDPRL